MEAMVAETGEKLMLLPPLLTQKGPDLIRTAFGNQRTPPSLMCERAETMKNV